MKSENLMTRTEYMKNNIQKINLLFNIKYEYVFRWHYMTQNFLFIQYIYYNFKHIFQLKKCFSDFILFKHYLGLTLTLKNINKFSFLHSIQQKIFSNEIIGSFLRTYLRQSIHLSTHSLHSDLY